jgi:hypothetical protein
MMRVNASVIGWNPPLACWGLQGGVAAWQRWRKSNVQVLGGRRVEPREYLVDRQLVSGPPDMGSTDEQVGVRPCTSTVHHVCTALYCYTLSRRTPRSYWIDATLRRKWSDGGKARSSSHPEIIIDRCWRQGKYSRPAILRTWSIQYSLGTRDSVRPAWWFGRFPCSQQPVTVSPFFVFRCCADHLTAHSGYFLRTKYGGVKHHILFHAVCCGLRIPWRCALAASAVTPERYSIWRFTSNPNVDQTNKLSVRKSTELFAVHLQVPTGKAGFALGLE